MLTPCVDGLVMIGTLTGQVVYQKATTGEGTLIPYPLAGSDFEG